MYINDVQYFDGVPQAVWDMHIGGYRVAEKWLKDRKGRQLSYDDLTHYQNVIAALARTLECRKASIRPSPLLAAGRWRESAGCAVAGALQGACTGPCQIRIDNVNTSAQDSGMDQWHRIGGTDFVWDGGKASANLAKHGVRIEEAATVFLDPLLVLVDASRNQEARDAVIGFDLQGRLLFVVHIERDGDHIRIISARSADALEEALYAQ